DFPKYKNNLFISYGYYSAYSASNVAEYFGKRPTTTFFTICLMLRGVTDDIVHTLREEILLITYAI
ncbi:TPA: hypothetical protein ACITS6_004038, partial [Salmonella enterica subsp. enterica serovar Saintpaul]